MIWRTVIPFVPACTFQSDQKFAPFDVLTPSFLWINNLPLNHMVSSLCREGTGSVAAPTCGFNYGLWRGESARQKQRNGNRSTDPRCFPFSGWAKRKEERARNKAWPDTECVSAIQNNLKCFPLGKNHVATFGHALKIRFIRGWLIFCVCAVPFQLLCHNDPWIAVRPLHGSREEGPSWAPIKLSQLSCTALAIRGVILLFPIPPAPGVHSSSATPPVLLNTVALLRSHFFFMHKSCWVCGYFWI